MEWFSLQESYHVKIYHYKTTVEDKRQYIFIYIYICIYIIYKIYNI